MQTRNNLSYSTS